MRTKNITLKILLLLVFCDLLETLAQFFFKKTAATAGTIHLATFNQVLTFMAGMLSCWYLWISFVSIALLFILWSTVLSKIDLSVAVPIASFSYVLVPIASVMFLHEKMNLLRWMGIAFILAGVIVVSLSAKKPEVDKA